MLRIEGFNGLELQIKRSEAALELLLAGQRSDLSPVSDIVVRNGATLAGPQDASTFNFPPDIVQRVNVGVVICVVGIC